jgi:hypothetical protein
MLDPEFRRYLDELYRTDDKLRTEHRAWKAEREAQAAAEYRTVDNDATEPAPVVEAEPSYEEVSTAPNFFDDVERNEEFADTLATVLAMLQDKWRDEIADETRKLAYMIERMAYPGEAAERLAHELQSRMLDVESRVRQLIQKTATAEPEIIDLPGNFLRHTSIDRDGTVTVIRRRDDGA